MGHVQLYGRANPGSDSQGNSGLRNIARGIESGMHKVQLDETAAEHLGGGATFITETPKIHVAQGGHRAAAPDCPPALSTGRYQRGPIR
ncbi:MAG: hypothetical protein JWP83_1326 [Mycobacterium sp.]|jgi:hypothetical protein|nr:hypothetical protein [Mycobacterium sp.]